jgi:UDPglucose 6-dehydrogenase
VTEWKEFYAVEPAEIASKISTKMVFDGRNIYDRQAMADAGLKYFSIGRG